MKSFHKIGQRRVPYSFLFQSYPKEKKKEKKKLEIVYTTTGDCAHYTKRNAGAIAKRMNCLENKECKVLCM